SEKLGLGVDRLYQQHLPAMIKEAAARLPQGEKRCALGLLSIRLPMTKIRYLLVHLGYTNCREELLKVSRERELLKTLENPARSNLAFATWPVLDPRDDRRTAARRHHRVHVPSDRRVQYYYGRRETDDPRVKAELIGVILGNTARNKGGRARGGST